MDMPARTGYARIAPSRRARIRRTLRRAYEHGASIRTLADQHGYSYWLVCQLLIECEIHLRSYGGRPGRPART